MEFPFSGQKFGEKSQQNQNLMKIFPLGAELFSADGQPSCLVRTDSRVVLCGRTAITKLVVGLSQFCQLGYKLTLKTVIINVKL